MLKEKLNWVQGICILLVAMLIVGGLGWFTTEEPEREPVEVPGAEPYIVTLRCPQGTTDPTNNLSAGKTLYFLNRTAEIGEIIDVRLIDWEQEVYDEEAGIYRKVIDPEDQLIEVRVQVMGKRGSGSFRVNGVAINVGQVIYPETDQSRSSATIVRIEPMAKEGAA